MSDLLQRYEQFLRQKVAGAALRGFDVPAEAVNPLCKPHQRDIIRWKIRGGTRANFSSFGTGKTIEEQETVRLIQRRENNHALLVARLANIQNFLQEGRLDTKEWRRRADELGLDHGDVVRDFGVDYRFVQSTRQIGDPGIYITNYESVREGKLDVSRFDCVDLDEASILRGFGGTKTFRELMRRFEGTAKFRFVDTATPSPNEYIELLAYSAFLGIMDVGEAKTRFFKRNSEHADELTIHPHKEREFWLWVSSWALFLQKPSDLGYSDEGYVLPKRRVFWHEIPSDYGDAGIEPSGQGRLVPNAAIGVTSAAREKRKSLGARVAKMLELRALDPGAHRVIWHDLENERTAIERAAPEIFTTTGNRSVQTLEEREAIVKRFEDGEIQELATKPVLDGRGRNFQRYCWWAIFLGIGFKFEDFIQALFRIDRFLQPNPDGVRIDLIYTEAERAVRENLELKWKQHDEMMERMSALIREYGLAANAIEKEMARSFGVQRSESRTANCLAVHNDAVCEAETMAADSVDLILTSIPFSTQYEYSPSYNDFGHTDSNEHFWEQMDFLIPNLFRILKPGRVAAVHVKDRIVPSGLTGMGFQVVYPFSDDCIRAFTKHGFGLLARKTIVTDVVRENNQTYRLGWTEQCKDGTKMGAGLPEYLLLFRKPPSDTSNGYADDPVVKSKADYTRSRWQIDAHGFMRSSGDRLLLPSDLAGVKHSTMFKMFRRQSLSHVYDYEQHVGLSESLERCQQCGHIHIGDRCCGNGDCPCVIDASRLPKTFMLLQPQSWHGDVWTDIARMRTQNGVLKADGREMHLCPLQFDICDRVIRQLSQPGELVFDPFAGVFTVPIRAMKLGRKGYGVELAANYFNIGRAYIDDTERSLATPSLFDLLEAEEDEDGSDLRTINGEIVRLPADAVMGAEFLNPVTDKGDSI